MLEFIEYFIIDLHDHCYDVSSTAISFLSIVFVSLQVTVIILYPRLNIELGKGLPHLGLMHLVATNLTIWLRTVIKETLHEMESHYLTSTDHSKLGHCRHKYHHDDFVASVLAASSPFLYAFIIEFSLVGGTVFYNTWNNIHILTREERLVITRTSSRAEMIKRPNLCATLAKTNWSQSTIGTVGGCLVLVLTLMDLVMFLTTTTHDKDIPFEYLGKILNTSINFLGFLAAVVAFFKIQKLSERRTPQENNTVDLFLLDFGVFFLYIYSCLTITVGLFNPSQPIPGSVHVINGVTEIMAVTAQTVLIHQLLLKTVDSDSAYLHGRTLVVFLSFVNFSIWLFDTFELQKSKASLIESGYYGQTTWIWLQRITLPVCVFFRSVSVGDHSPHSAVQVPLDCSPGGLLEELLQEGSDGVLDIQHEEYSNRYSEYNIILRT